MSNELYRVDIKKVGKSEVALRLVIQDAESGNLPATKAWALMLVQEALAGGHVKNASIANATAALKGEAAYVKRAANHIASVALVKTKNFPVAHERRYNETEASTSARTAAWGEYKITFTDGAWTKGWKPGITWQSTSYAPPERSAVEAVPVVTRTEKRQTYYFAGRFKLLDTARRKKVLKSLNGVELPELTTAVDYLVLADKDPKHPDLERAWTVTAMSVITESELIEHAAQQSLEKRLIRARAR